VDNKITNRLIFVEQNDTWGKLGYVLHGDSMAFRDVLEDNPGWDMTKLPAPGTVLFTTSMTNMTGSLTGFPYIDRIGPERVITEDTFPWESSQTQADRLMSYSPSAINYHKEINRGY
jgi:hypothetical protein